MSRQSKILYIDIEWEPATAYVWRMWDENISPDQLIDEGGMLCFCAKWSDQREYMFFSKWEHGREGMARAALDLLTEAEIVVTYNGDKYDLPKITGEILLAGLDPPPNPASVDLLKTVKKFGFVMNRLAYIGPLLVEAKKVKHEGFRLWRDVMDGKASAEKKMKRYCIQDVRLLVKLYDRIKPYIKNHPHATGTSGKCANCGSDKLHRRGYRHTRCFRIQRVQCQNCGSWGETTRRKIA